MATNSYQNMAAVQQKIREIIQALMALDEQKQGQQSQQGSAKQGGTPDAKNVAMQLAATYGKNKVMEYLFNLLQGGSAGATGAGSIGGGVSAANTTVGQLASGVTPVGTAMNGGTLMSDGSVFQGSMGPSAGGTVGTGRALQGNTGAWIAMANDAYNAYKGSTNDALPKNQQAQEFTKNVGMGVADYFTGGLASLGRTLANQTGFGRKVERKVDDLMMKMPLEKVLAYSGAFGGLSTKNKEKARWGEVGQKEGMDADTVGAAYLANHPEGDTGIISEGPLAGRKWNFDEVNKDVAERDPSGFVWVLGNMETFGPGWKDVPLDQKKQIVQQLAKEGLYQGNKGDVIIRDRDRAKQIYDSVIGGTAGATTDTGTEETQTKPAEWSADSATRQQMMEEIARSLGMPEGSGSTLKMAPANANRDYSAWNKPKTPWPTGGQVDPGRYPTQGTWGTATPSQGDSSWREIVTSLGLDPDKYNIGIQGVDPGRYPANQPVGGSAGRLGNPNGYAPSPMYDWKNPDPRLKEVMDAAIAAGANLKGPGSSIGAALGQRATNAAQDDRSDPRSRAGYNQLSAAQKEALWQKHRKAMGATW